MEIKRLNCRTHSTSSCYVHIDGEDTLSITNSQKIEHDLPAGEHKIQFVIPGRFVHKTNMNSGMNTISQMPPLKSKPIMVRDNDQLEISVRAGLLALRPIVLILVFIAMILCAYLWINEKIDFTVFFYLLIPVVLIEIISRLFIFPNAIKVVKTNGFSQLNKKDDHTGGLIY